MLTNKQVLNWVICSDPEISARIKKLKKQRKNICVKVRNLAEKIKLLREFDDTEFKINQDVYDVKI